MGGDDRPAGRAGGSASGRVLSERSAFEERGYVGPVALLDPADCPRVLARLRSAAEPEWVKGHAVASAAFRETGSLPQVVDLVSSLIGEDVLLWGAMLVRREPGEVHPWHTDIETSGVAGRAGRTVSVWIGLENTTCRSSLQVVPGSHRIGATLQEVAGAAGRRRSEITADDVLGWARRTLPDGRIETFDMTDGEAICFDGGLWHGTNNTNPAGARTALLLQYATPDRPIRMPDYGQLEWPFRLLESPLPPCLLVQGEDRFGVNLVVQPAPEPGPAG